MGRFNSKVYIAYSIFYAMGTLLAIQVPFIGFQAIKAGEHLLSHGVFIIVQIYALTQFLRTIVSQKTMEMFVRLIRLFVILAILIVISFFIYQGSCSWGGRIIMMFDPTYGDKYLPILVSVSEQQASYWAATYDFCSFLLLLVPVGFYVCFCGQKTKTNYGKLFIALFAITSIYFSSIMMRLQLLLAFSASIMAAIGASKIIRKSCKTIRKFFSPVNIVFNVIYREMNQGHFQILLL